MTRHREDLEEWCSVLAQHFAQSADPTQALPYLVQTGERAQRVYANAEAVQALAQALAILQTVPPTAATRRQQADLTVQLATLHALLGDYRESLELYTRALEEARAAGDMRAIPRLEMRVGRIRYEMGDTEPALADLHGALELAQGMHDTTRLAICCQNLGDVYFTSGSLPKAIEYYRRALHISEEADNLVGVAAACTFLSNAHARAGDLQEAVQYGRRALALGEQLHDDRRIAWACIMLTQAYYEAGADAEIGPLRDRAVHVCEKMGDYRGIAWTKTALWYQAVRGKDFTKAVEATNILIHMGQASGGFQHEVSSQLARGAEHLLRLGRYQEAFAYCQQSLAISLKTSNKLEYGYAYMVLAEVYASDVYRDWDKAAWYLDKSLKAFREVGAKVDVGRSHLAGARIALLRGDGTARQWTETARDVFAQHGAKALLKEAEELLAEIESRHRSGRTSHGHGPP